MSGPPSTSSDRDLLDQTVYLARRIYDDPQIPPVSLDLHSACAIGNYDCVQDAINSDKNLNARNKAGWTPLMYASYVGHDTIVNLLLDSGAEPTRGTPSSLTPLMVAAGCGNESVCYFLIQAGAEIDIQDSNGYTALIHAVRQGHQTVVQLLLESGADLELQDENSYTALMLAAQEGDEIIVDVLVACGANLDAQDKRGNTARAIAYSKHHVRTVTLLDNAIYILQSMPTPTSPMGDIIEEDEENLKYEDSQEDLFSGAKEYEAYQQSRAVKKSIQFNLGRRSGPRWSLPHEYIALRRSTAPAASKLKSALSMPEREFPPEYAEPDIADSKLADFLSRLGLEKYLEVFQEQEIDFHDLLMLNDDDLKRIGIKLMGPRRKLSLAISELREHSDQTKEERKEEEEEVVEEMVGEERNEHSGTSHQKKSRPQLMKQPSTELTAAYRQAMETIEHLQGQLAQEHQLRKTTDSFLLELQTARQRAVGCVRAVKDTQRDIVIHSKSVKNTYGKVTQELDGLRLLTSSTTIDPKDLQKFYTELVSLNSRMGMELEALSRTVDSATQYVDTLSFHLTSNS